MRGKNRKGNPADYSVEKCRRKLRCHLAPGIETQFPSAVYLTIRSVYETLIYNAQKVGDEDNY